MSLELAINELNTNISTLINVLRGGLTPPPAAPQQLAPPSEINAPPEPKAEEPLSYADVAAVIHKVKEAKGPQPIRDSLKVFNAKTLKDVKEADYATLKTLLEGYL